MEEEKKKTVGEKLDDIINQLEQKEKKKKFKLPFGIRMQKGKTRKKNYAIVQTIKTNGAVNFKMQKIEDDTVTIGEGIYDASAGHILRYKRYPLVIIPEWNMKPFSPKEDFDEATKEGTLVAAEKVILSKMKLEAIKPKMALTFKTIIIILIIGGVLLYLLDYLKIL